MSESSGHCFSPRPDGERALVSTHVGEAEFLRPKGAVLCQPRATPWVQGRRSFLSPEGAALTWSSRELGSPFQGCFTACTVT